MMYSIIPIPFKPPRLIGLSEDLLRLHYVQKYGAAVRRLNAAPAEQYLIAANEVLLCEVFYDSLGGEDGLGSVSVPPIGDLAAGLVRDFGSIDAWRADFRSLACTPDQGWAVLCYSPRLNRLFNIGLDDGERMSADAVPILCIDVNADAYRLDFGARTSDYVNDAMKNIHWERAARRLGIAMTSAVEQSLPDDRVSAEHLRDALSGNRPPLVLDICLEEDMAKRTDKIPGARICPPDRIDDWLNDLPMDRAIIGYCVYGYQISGNAVAAMRAKGFDARALAGGITAWHAIAGEAEPL